MRTQRVEVAEIHVGARQRDRLNEDTVSKIAASIKEIGLQNPISICFRDGIEIDGELHDGIGCLVAGAHRRAALISLGKGYEYIDAIVFDDPIAARKWEISENLHREDLTVEERSEHINEWVKLTLGQREELQSAQLEPIESKRKDGKGHRPESGINVAARELGITRAEAQRAAQIASLSEGAKSTARQLGMDNNQTVLLAAARDGKAAAQKAKTDGADVESASQAKAEAETARIAKEAEDRRRKEEERKAGAEAKREREQRETQEIRDQAEEAVELLGRDNMPYVLTLLEGSPKKLAAAIRSLLQRPPHPT